MNLAQRARRYASTIRTGVVLAIDPASGGTSLPGWALWVAGQFDSSGVVPLYRNEVQFRLAALHKALAQQQPDVLVIERIRGARAHAYLQWSVGVSVAACCPQLLFEMPVSLWKSLAGPDHQKSDEADAVAIGQALFTLAGRDAA